MMNQISKRIVLVVILIMMSPFPSVAGDWGGGIAVATQTPPLLGAKREYLGAPYLTFQGEHFKVDLGAISYSFYENSGMDMVILGEFRFDGYEPQDNDELAGLTKRHSSFDVGLGVSHTLDWGLLELVLLGDVMGTHDGLEVRATYTRPYQVGRWLFAPSIGGSWESKALVDYYYGVDEDEIAVGRPIYVGSHAANVFAEFSSVYFLSDKTEVLTGFKYIEFDEGISNSPIVARGNQASFITSFLYKF